MQSSSSITGTARLSFPFSRVLVAMLVVSAFTTMVVDVFSTTDVKLSELWRLLLLGIFFAGPGWVMFLVFGLPTIFILHRRHQTGFTIFALFGMLYTAIAPAIFDLYLVCFAGGNLRALITGVFICGLIGLINGLITRLIVYGWRDRFPAGPY